MIRVTVIRDGFDADLIGQQDFVVMPEIGSIIHVKDRNGNAHRLYVDRIESIGISADPERAKLQELIEGPHRLVVVGSGEVSE